jgi:hypothetical protein
MSPKTMHKQLQTVRRTFVREWMPGPLLCPLKAEWSNLWPHSRLVLVLPVCSRPPLN